MINDNVKSIGRKIIKLLPEYNLFIFFDEDEGEIEFYFYKDDANCTIFLTKEYATQGHIESLAMDIATEAKLNFREFGRVRQDGRS